MEVVKRTLLVSFFCWTCCFALENAAEESDENFLLSLVWKCSKSEDLSHCLKLKAAKMLDKLVRTKDPLVITEYLSLAKNPKISQQNFQEMNTSWGGKLAKTEERKNEELDTIIWNKLVSLFMSRTLQMSLSTNAFEGRGKEDKIFKKGHGIFLMGAMMSGMMLKMAMAKIALIAGKALIIGKIALVLSLIIALKKLSSHGGGGGPEVVYTSAEHATGRKFTSDTVWDEDGARLAYNAYKPNTYTNM